MKKVITYGTFDLFHQGHYNILKRAKERGDYLIVGVTSESYDIERGKLSVVDSLSKRIENVMKTGLVDEIIIEEYLGQKIADIIKHEIDVFVIGSDWQGKFDHLSKYCEVVYLERTKNISSTQIREQKDNLFKIGMIVDSVDDNEIIEELKYVSGFHIDSVLCEDEKIGAEFCDKYGIGEYCTNEESFFEKIDVAIVLTKLEKRHIYIKTALLENKHVLSAAPFSLDINIVKELFALAKKQHSILIENIPIVYSRFFIQLLWIAKSNIVGKIVNMKCTLSAHRELECGKSILNYLTLIICMAVKFTGLECETAKIYSFSHENEDTGYINTSFIKDSMVVTTEIATNMNLESSLTVVGERAIITITDDWWNTGYFEVRNNVDKTVKKYSYNFEGTGFRYIAQELLIMLRDGRTEATRLFERESLAIVNILNKIIKEGEIKIDS